MPSDVSTVRTRGTGVRAEPARRFALLLVAAIVTVSCASRRPVLYRNAHYQAVGEAEARRDVDLCLRDAREYADPTHEAQETAKSTAKGAGVGAATGAAYGAVRGGAGSRAAAGAAGGATAGLLSRLFFRSRPDPVQRRVTERCLVRKGYEPIGWR